MVRWRLPEEEQLAIEAPEEDGQPIQPGVETQVPEGVPPAETSAPTVSPAPAGAPAPAGTPAADGLSEPDVASDPTQGEEAPDATGSPPDEQLDTPVKKEGAE